MGEYYISGYNIKEIQNKMLEILIEVDRICNENNIRYVLDSGTLLGAIRNKGFIPWDDDIDIAMLREDYDRFCEIANKEMKPPFYFEFEKGNTSFPNIFGKCFNMDTLYVQKNSSHLDFPKGIWLDVFPIDNVNPKTKKLQCRLVASINMVRCIKLKTENFELRHLFYLPLFILPMKLLNWFAEKIMRFYNNKPTEFVCPICQSGVSKPMFKRSMFTDRILTDFEDYSFPVPKEYMEYLLGYYKTPMELPPESSRHPTHGVIEIKL